MSTANGERELSEETRVHPATPEDVLKARQSRQTHARWVLAGVATFTIVMTVIISITVLAFHVHDVNSHKVEVGLESCIKAGHAGYDADRTSCIG
jgi:predicted anti-sigma-YlaC factor YlaD